MNVGIKLAIKFLKYPHKIGGLKARLSMLSQYLSQHKNTQIQIIKQILISEQNQVKTTLDKVVVGDEEGIVVQNPNTPYQTGRTNSILKVKKYLDAEYVIKKILFGKVKYKDKM